MSQHLFGIRNVQLATIILMVFVSTTLQTGKIRPLVSGSGLRVGSRTVNGVEYRGIYTQLRAEDLKIADQPGLNPISIPPISIPPISISPISIPEERRLDLFFPERFDQPFVVEGGGVQVTLKTVGGAASPLRTAEGELRYDAVYRHTDSLHRLGNGRSEEFLYLHDASAPTSFEYELTEIEGAENVSLQSRAIVFSRGGSPVLQIEAPWVIDADGQRSDEAVRWELAPADGDGSRRLRLNLDPAGLRYPLTVDPSWSVISSTTITSSAPRSVRLQNGKVLVALDNGASAVNLYDPSTGAWSATGSFVAGRRALESLTVLQNGKVLAAGGADNSGAMSSAELYDPATGTWSSTGSLSQRRMDHRAVLLSNGKVLVTGGYNYPFTGVGTDLEYPELVEIYDPSTGTWSSMGNARPRLYHQMTLLTNGKVLVVGGYNNTVGNFATPEIYDPTANTWTDAGTTGTRMEPTATLLNDGKVLVVGGRTSGAGGADSGLTTALLYDPVAGTWSSTGSQSNKRSSHTATLLSNGNVLVVGGENPVGTSLSTTEIYDSAAGTWSSAGSLTTARRFHAATLLADGAVLIIGGTTGSSTYLSSVERYGNPNQTPTITAATGVTRTAGAAVSNSTIATVTDAETAAGSLTVTVTSANPSNGVTISNISNTTGTITADIVAATGATSATFTLQVSDGTATATATLSVAVTSPPASPPITGDGGDVTSPNGNKFVGPGAVVTITQTLRNSSSTPMTTTFVGTLPDGLNALTGGCSASIGSCEVGTSIAPGGNLNGVYRKLQPSSTLSNNTVTWSVTIPGNGSATISILVQVSSQATNGTQYCITSTLGGAVGPTTCLLVGVAPAGAGAQSLLATPAHDQKPGSVLIYNLYTSSLNPAQSDTRITLTNTNPVNMVSVHLFFVDGTTCAVADQFVRLTQNQTVSLLASDIDPGVTGYIIAVATNEYGCPEIYNDLIGETFVKFESGHKANLPAIGVSGLAAGTQLCTGNTVTATLAFDGVQYNELPRTLAIDSLAAPATGNSTMLVVNRLGGNLTTGAATLGNLSGLLFDDLEASQSFVLTGGTCQLRGILGNNFPRTAPRYTTVIPAGRTGWMKFSSGTDQAISGVMINETTVGSSQHSGGHNLHALSTTAVGQFVIPVFPAL